MKVWLVNPAHMHAVPGRKTDVKDAGWIAQPLEDGLLTPSFVPPPEIRRLRMLTRHRVQLMGDRTPEAVRLELMLEDASIKLSTVDVEPDSRDPLGRYLSVQDEWSDVLGRLPEALWCRWTGRDLAAWNHGSLLLPDSIRQCQTCI